MTTETPARITQASATAIGYCWHGGASSPLYRFACWGGIVQSEEHRAELVTEIQRDIAGLASYPSEEQAREGPKLWALLDYIEHTPVEA